MRLFPASVLLLPTPISGFILQRAASTEDASPALPAQAASTPTSHAPAETLIVEMNVLEYLLTSRVSQAIVC